MDQLISLGVAGQEDLFARFKYQGDGCFTEEQHWNDTSIWRDDSPTIRSDSSANYPTLSWNKKLTTWEAVTVSRTSESSLDDHQQLSNLYANNAMDHWENRKKLLGPEQSGNKINKGDRSGPDHDAWTFSMVARKIGSEGCRTRTFEAIFAREVAPFFKMLRSCHLPSSVLLSVQPLFGFNDFTQINWIFFN